MSEGIFQKKFYNKWKGYNHDPNIKTVEERYQKIRNYIKEEGIGKKILDVGCADGALLEPFVKNSTVQGIEIVENLSRRAKQKGIKTIQANLEEGIPLPDGTFDIIVAAQILEHIVNTDFFLSECNRVLKEGGKIILSVPNINTLFSPIIMFLFDYPPTSSSRYRSPHVKDFTFSTLKVALQNNGFLIEKKRGVVFYIPLFKYFSKIRSFLADLLPRFSDEYIVKAKKIKSTKYDEEITIRESGYKSLMKKLPFFKWFLK